MTNSKPSLPFAAIALLSILLPTLIVLGILPFAWRFYVLVGVALLVAVAAISERMSAAEMGLTTENLPGALKAQAPLVAAFVALLLCAPLLGLGGRKSVPESPFFYIFYVAVSSPAQELIYRSYFHAEAKRLDWPPLATIALLVVPYVYLHVIYKDALTLGFVTIVGVAWAALYARRPNLLAVSLSHAILGIVTIRLGLI